MISLAIVLDARSSSAEIGLGGEVEAQPVGRDQRALLRDVGAEHLGAAPRAADASPSGWRAGRARRHGSTFSSTASPTFSVPSVDRAGWHEEIAEPSSACR
jgi:hypothetical protein